VNPWTGEPYHLGNWDGDLAAQRGNGSYRSVYDLQYLQDYVNPSYRTDPRTVLIGASWEW
jgi:hypothetical protein